MSQNYNQILGEKKTLIIIVERCVYDFSIVFFLSSFANYTFLLSTWMCIEMELGVNLHSICKVEQHKYEEL